MSSMQLLFCYNPELRKLPEPLFEPEVDAAREVGFTCHLMGFDEFVDGRIDRALQFLPEATHEPILYRGWIFNEGEYRRLDEHLRARGYELLTTPDAYAEALYLPNHHRLIAEWTTPAVWTVGTDLGQAWRTARSLGDGPWIVKDYVKSNKHQWEDSCFIPERVDRERFEEICQNLQKYLGPRFERGFVFKQFIPLRRLGEGLYEYPLCEEYRLFFYQGRLLMAATYNRTGGTETEFARFEAIAGRFPSPFLTLDVARTETGDWLIIEAGDGGVSSLAPNMDPLNFYQRLRERSSS